ncbi:MAG: alpha/beta hydrolase [Comamonadaceae bacterium]|jgi:arylformamidase|nr:alpha/beta hydrolase [Comamonadaceae bacterium]
MKLNDPVWLEQMYNNRALVPAFPEHAERWLRDSAQARVQMRCALDLRYGLSGRERLDVFAAERPGAPVVVFIHGGYWRALDKSDHSFVAPALHGMGAAVVVPSYDLCPAVGIPQITLQMVRALAWVWHHIDSFNGDPRRITVIGHSAGGHLSAMMLNCLWQQFDPALPPDLVRRALSISGLHDLEPVSRAPFLQVDLRLSDQDVRRASPIRLPAPNGTLYAVAGADESQEFIRQTRLIEQAWGPKVVPVCETLPGLNHFSVIESLCEPGSRLNQLARQLIELSR